MAYKYETKNCKHCKYCVKTDKGLYCSHTEGNPKVTGGGWCIDMLEKEWQTEIIEIRKYYAKCPYCEFSFEMQRDRELPYFCGACGRRLRGEENGNS